MHVWGGGENLKRYTLIILWFFYGQFSQEILKYCSCNDIDNGGCDAENNILDKAVDSFNSPVHDTGCPAYLTGLMPPEK